MTAARPALRLLRTEACVARGAAWLAGVEPRFAAVLQATGPWPLRLRPDGFGALQAAIVGQQVSTASASAILKRLQAAGLDRPGAVAAATDADLGACGLSRAKMRYLRALAEAGLDFDALRDLPDAALQARLVALPGVGPWTAQVYAMLSLGRADVFAPADLALQEGARLAFDLPARPRPAELERMAAAWSPWRGVAARGLWTYYRLVKKREGIG